MIFAAFQFIWIFTILIINSCYADTWDRFEDRAYYIDRMGGVSFSDAERRCYEKRAKLPVVTIDSQMRFITETIRGRWDETYWLNMLAPEELCQCEGNEENTECRKCRASWRWKDGSEMRYESWLAYRPQAGNRRCAIIRADSGSWDDTTCSNHGNSFRYMCQYDCSENGCHMYSCSGDRRETYRCHCDVGYTGDICDQDIDECASNPCFNMGTCQNMINWFNCRCLEGTTGTRCETNIDDCADIDCGNGVCQDGLNKYMCECESGFTGKHCETNIDDCESDPCQNGGTCIDLISAYNCECAGGYFGDSCEENEDDDAIIGVLIPIQIVTAITATLSLTGCGISAYMYCKRKRQQKALNTEENVSLHQI